MAVPQYGERGISNKPSQTGEINANLSDDKPSNVVFDRTQFQRDRLVVAGITAYALADILAGGKITSAISLASKLSKPPQESDPLSTPEQFYQIFGDYVPNSLARRTTENGNTSIFIFTRNSRFNDGNGNMPYTDRRYFRSRSCCS